MYQRLLYHFHKSTVNVLFPFYLFIVSSFYYYLKYIFVYSCIRFNWYWNSLSTLSIQDAIGRCFIALIYVRNIREKEATHSHWLNISSLKKQCVFLKYLFIRRFIKIERQDYTIFYLLHLISSCLNFYILMWIFSKLIISSVFFLSQI